MLTHLQALERPAPLTERIYRELKDNIQSARLKPGEAIREVDLCERFNVSRTPVREALQRLQHEGLVETQGVKGLVVATLTRHDIEEIYQLRLILEVGAITLACTAPGGVDKLAHTKAMADAIRQAGVAAKTGDSELFIESNRAFRNAWLSLVPNERLTRAVKLYAGHVRALQASTLTRPSRQKTVLAGMRAIQQAITSGDPIAGEAAMRSYLALALSAMLELAEFSEVTRHA